MTTIVGQSIGILRSMRIGQAARLNGNRYATFHQLTAKQAEKLYEDSRLYDVGSIVNVGDMELGNSGLTLYLREYHDNALAMYPDTGKIKEGCLPENENEIALSDDALKLLNRNVSVGDTISLDLTAIVQDGSIPKYSYSADFVLTAILESSYLGYSTEIVEGIVGNGTAEKLLPNEYLLYSIDFKTHSKADFQEIIDDLAASLYLDNYYIQYNWILLDALGISYHSAESFDSGIVFLCMVFACVLVGDLLLQSWEVLGIAGLDDERLFLLSSDLKETDKKALLDGLACFVKNPFPLSIGGEDIECTELSVGDKIQIEGLTLSVLGIVNSPIAINNSGFKNGVQIIVSDEVYDRITGETRYMEVYPTLTVDADLQQFEMFLDECDGIVLWKSI